MDGTVGSDRLISLTRTDEPRKYFSFDGLRSVVNLTDDSGTAAASYHLDAWGNYRFPSELTASKNRFGFTGYIYDEETKLWFARARFYDPETARFTTQDSYPGKPDDPPSLHRYFYANDNPTRYVDPSGHESVLPQLAEREKVADIAKFKQEVFKADPKRFADSLTEEEGIFLDRFKAQRLDPSRLNETQVKEARSLFGDNKDAFEQYANYQARSQLIFRYAMSDPNMKAYVGDLYRLARDVNPVHFVGERLQQVATGEEALTGQETGRVRPALELAAAYGLGKLANFLLGKAVEPAPFGGQTSRTPVAAEAENPSLIGQGQRIIQDRSGTYIVGPEDQALFAKVRLGSSPAPRNVRAQSDLAGKQQGDEAGHLVAARFGASGESYNLAPMARSVNRGTYKQLENHLARLQRQGHEVEMEVITVPGSQAQRPDRFVVTYNVDGRPTTVVFENPAPTKK